MKAIILAAGISSRLRPLTDSVPKCLLEIGERTLLGRTFDALIENGINDFVVVTGYRQQQIVDFLNQNYSDQTITFVHNKDYASTNNIYSLWLASPLIKDEDVLLLDSDILFDSRIIKILLQSTKDNVLALNNHELGDEEIKLILDEENKVLEISKTCSIANAAGESIGIEKMSFSYFQALYKEMEIMIKNEDKGNVFYERAFERLIAQNHFFYAIDTTQYFSAELDTVEDFENTKRLLSHNLD